MLASSSVPPLLTSLESLLVKEFRALQNLFALTRDERTALTAYNCEALLLLVEQKEILLDELGRLDSQRKSTFHELSQSIGQRFPTPSELLATLDAATADRITRLQEGMTVIAEKIRELTPGNQVLAASAMERLDATQTFLLKLFQPPTGYQPAYYTPALQPAITFDLDHRT